MMLVTQLLKKSAQLEVCTGVDLVQIAGNQTREFFASSAGLCELCVPFSKLEMKHDSR
jgi:hypothetical protein